MANDLSAFNAEIWSKRLIEKLDPMNVMLPLVNRDWEGDLRQGNLTAKVRTLGNVAMSTYTKNSTTVSYQDLAPTVENFTVSDAKYFAFEVDDVDAAQNDMRVLDGYIGRSVVAVNNTIESKILAAYTNAGVKLGAAQGTGPLRSSPLSAATATVPRRLAPSRAVPSTPSQ